MSLNDELQHTIRSRLVQEFFKNFQQNSSTIPTASRSFLFFQSFTIMYVLG